MSIDIEWRNLDPDLKTNKKETIPGFQGIANNQNSSSFHLNFYNFL